jgi:hypothetical protein
MSADSPAVIPFDILGRELSVRDGYETDLNQSGLIIAGTDGYGTTQFLRTDTQGRPVITGTGPSNSVPISGSVMGSIVSGSISGNVTATQGPGIDPGNRWAVGLSDGSDFYQQLPVQIQYTAGEILPEQEGADDVLTFTFSQPMKKIFMESNGMGDTSRLDPFGGTPSSTLGIPCHHLDRIELEITVTTVKVFAPTGTKVNVWGTR